MIYLSIIRTCQIILNNFNIGKKLVAQMHYGTTIMAEQNNGLNINFKFILLNIYIYICINY